MLTRLLHERNIARVVGWDNHHMLHPFRVRIIFSPCSFPGALPFRVNPQDEPRALDLQAFSLRHHKTSRFSPRGIAPGSGLAGLQPGHPEGVLFLSPAQRAGKPCLTQNSPHPVGVPLCGPGNPQDVVERSEYPIPSLCLSLYSPHATAIVHRQRRREG
jgi:hypothetical protein